MQITDKRTKVYRELVRTYGTGTFQDDAEQSVAGPTMYENPLLARRNVARISQAGHVVDKDGRVFQDPDKPEIRQGLVDFTNWNVTDTSQTMERLREARKRRTSTQ